MQARLKYASGWQLVIPKTGNAPMLFLEWLASKRAGYSIVHAIFDDIEGMEPGHFRIRMNVLKEGYLEAKEYINANL